MRFVREGNEFLPRGGDLLADFHVTIQADLRILDGFVRAVEHDLVAEGLDADRILGRTVEAPTTVEPVWICPCGGGPVVVAVRPAGGEEFGMCRTCAGIYDDVDRGGTFGGLRAAGPGPRRTDGVSRSGERRSSRRVRLSTSWHVITEGRAVLAHGAGAAVGPGRPGGRRRVVTAGGCPPSRSTCSMTGRDRWGRVDVGRRQGHAAARRCRR